MPVSHAKASIEEFFDRQVKSVRISKCNAKLPDDESLSMSGVKPYANQLRMTILPV